MMLLDMVILTETLREQLVRHEGLRLEPYSCTEGFTTIGVGRNLESNGISHEEAMFMLDNDIAEFTEEVRDRIDFFDELSEARQNVLINMAFNMGTYGLMKFKKMLAAMQEQDFEEAAAQMLDSRWSTQVGNRSRELADIMRQD